MNEVRRLRPMLGTYVEVAASGPKTLLDPAISAAFAAMQEVHDLASFQSPDSPLSQLNRQPGIALELPFSLIMLLRLACLMTERSGQLFNCTVGGEMVQAGVLPDHGGSAVLARGDAQDIAIRGRQVCLRRPVRITLDGIAKGFAVDRAIRTMRAHGVTAGWVNAGGDLRAFGPAAIPVQRREPNGHLTSLGWLREAAVATSVAWPRPDERYPAWLIGSEARSINGVASVWTVMARRAWRADALTKVAALASVGQRRSLVEALGGHILEPVET